MQNANNKLICTFLMIPKINQNKLLPLENVETKHY